MRILLISEFFPTGKDLKFSGGVEARTYFVGKEIAKRHTVYVITSRTPGTKDRETINKINVIRVGKTRNYRASAGAILSRINFIKEAISKGKNVDADVVDGSNFITHFIAKRIASCRKIPVIAWYPDVWVGHWYSNAGLSGLFGELLERINLRSKFDAYISISKVTAQKLKKFVEGKIYVIYCGVNTSEFKAKSEKFSLPTVVCISRLTSYKRVEDLVWAFANLIKKGTKMSLLIIGQGPEEKKLRRIIQMLKLNKYVIFKRNLPRRALIQCLKSSYAFCLPSEVEGFGISVIESMAAGIPYVVSDIPVFKEITQNGKGGLIFKTGNIIDLTKKLDNLLVDKDLYTRKLKEGRHLARNYSWHNVAVQTEKIYKTVTGKA